MGKVQDFKMKVLVIGGTHKSGTTSLFSYLASHPEISRPFIKQTFFFTSSTFKAARGLRSYSYVRDGLVGFLSYFKKTKSNQWLLDATPDYLYDVGALDALVEVSRKADVKLIFVLRDPVERFISWFKYAKQIHAIPMSMTFKDFYENQVHDFGVHICFNALETGNYSSYLSHWMDRIGKENVHIVGFEDLKTSAHTVMTELCDYLDVEPSFYKNFDFHISNKTKENYHTKLTPIYLNLRNRINYFIGRRQYIAKFVYPFFSSSIRLIRKFRIKPKPNSYNLEEIEDDVLVKIQSYYSLERSKTEELVANKFNW